MNIFIRRITKIVVFILIVNLICNDAATINRTGSSEENLGTRKLVVEKCRQQCFLQTMDNWKFSKSLESKESVEACHGNSNCYMCYDYCRVLVVAKPDLSRAMCNDPVYCMKGCQVACTFHRLKTLSPLIYQVVNNS